MYGGRHAWQGGMVGGVHDRGYTCQILRDTVNERAVRILLECILVSYIFFIYVTILLIFGQKIGQLKFSLLALNS